MHQSSRDDIELLQIDNLPLPDRRACIASISVGIISTAASASAKKTDLLSTLRTLPTQDNNLLQLDELNEDKPITITLPLELSSGGTLSVRVIFTSDESVEVCKAIVDTGSPYLVLPSSNNNNPGSLLAKLFNIASAKGIDDLLLSQSKYSPTEEVYGAVTGNINWKLGKYAFRDDRLQITDSSSNLGVVGVLDEALTSEATGGGVYEPLALLGLIRNNNPNRRPRFPEARPTYLDQECIISNDASDDNTNNQYRIKSFSLDGPSRELTLSTQTLIPTTMASVMELVDLRTVGDFVDHYAVLVESITFDDVSVTAQSLQTFTKGRIVRPIVAVFDSGLTGCLLIRNFANVIEQYMTATDRGSTSVHVDEFTSVSLSLKSKQKQTTAKRVRSCNIKSSTEEDPRLFYVQPIDLDWFDNIEYSPYVVVLGQTFLSQGIITIDIDERVATFIT